MVFIVSSVSVASEFRKKSIKNSGNYFKFI